MESIVVLPEPNTLIKGTRIELFGLLSQTTNTACCHQAIHCRYFEPYNTNNSEFYYTFNSKNAQLQCVYKD